ncbi:MAG: putative metal-binding motif-containing protein [Candidatus Saganbacteria bacterium]|nr:putative metal-binding motif-containing protein [Candidatus Saganbacteria bacterium]
MMRDVAPRVGGVADRMATAMVHSRCFYSLRALNVLMFLVVGAFSLLLGLGCSNSSSKGKGLNDAQNFDVTESAVKDAVGEDLKTGELPSFLWDVESTEVGGVEVSPPIDTEKELESPLLCIPEEESCDGKDNDCDGQTDELENFPIGIEGKITLAAKLNKDHFLLAFGSSAVGSSTSAIAVVGDQGEVLSTIDTTKEDADGDEYTAYTRAPGGFALAGRFFIKGQYATAARLTGYDDDGNIVWDQQYLDVKKNNPEISGVSLSKNGGFLLVGTGNVAKGKGLSSAWVIKTDSFGNLEWDESVDYSPEQTFGRSLLELDKGAPIVGGNINGFPWWTKRAPGGGEIWAKTYDDVGKGTIWGLERGGEGEFYMLGTKDKEDAKYGWVIRMEGEHGAVTWEKETEAIGIYGSVRGKKIEGNEGGGFWLYGHYGDESGLYGVYHETNMDGEPVYSIKFEEGSEVLNAFSLKGNRIGLFVTSDKSDPRIIKLCH